MTMAINIERWRDGTLEADEERTLHIGMYFKNEMLLMLEKAGFTVLSRGLFGGFGFLKEIHIKPLR